MAFGGMGIISWTLVFLATLTCVSCLTDEVKKALTAGGKLTIEDSYSGDSSYYSVKANGIPDHTTDDFPTSYNPNSIQAQAHVFAIPKTPKMASSSKCLPMGAIAVAISGVSFFNPYTANMDNAVEGPNAEQFDACDGHPAPQGVYHYHKNPSCIGASKNQDAVVGVALDGYPIRSMYDSNGDKITSKDLDECHGRCNDDGGYSYYLTEDFPYVLGCFKGELHSSVRVQGMCEKAISDSAIDDGECVGTASVVHANLLSVVTVLVLYPL